MDGAHQKNAPGADTPGRGALTRKRIACQRRFSGRQRIAASPWVTIVMREKCGSCVGLTGRLSTDNYTNKDGQKVTNVIVIAEEVEFCEKKEDNPAPEQKPEWLDIPANEELPFNF